MQLETLPAPSARIMFTMSPVQLHSFCARSLSLSDDNNMQPPADETGFQVGLGE